MKKIFSLFAAVLFAAGLFAQSYGILVNGNTYYSGTQVAEFDGFTQYLAHVPVEAGDQLQLCDFDAKATWAVTLDGASVSGFSLNGDHYDVTVSGCFDFYIKLKYQQDQLYVGPGSDCGEGVPYTSGGGQGGGGGETGSLVGWFFKGYIDGADVEPSMATRFSNGTAAFACSEKSYIFVIRQTDGLAATQYMHQGYAELTTSATLLPNIEGAGGGDKVGIEAGMYTLYLYDNGDGSVELSLNEIPGKTLVSDDAQGIEETLAPGKARKEVINGQLRIVRGDKVFDATGRQL